MYGGIKSSLENSNELYCFDLVENIWTLLGRYGNPIDSFSCEVYKGKLIIFSGYEKDYVNNIKIYNPFEKTFNIVQG